MNSTKVTSIVLVFALGVFVCMFTSACTNNPNQGISIKKESRFKQMQRQETRNPKVVYLGSNDNYSTSVNFGPHDVNFEMKSLR